MKSYVFSRTLPPSEHPDVRIVSDNAGDVVRSLKKQPGKDIWLFGGGSLFAILLDAGVVDAIEVAVIPVILGAGRPLLPEGRRTRLRLTSNRTYQKTGIVALEYAVTAR
jgi:dihydrofolate reductase